MVDTMSKVQVNVGSLADMGKRFTRAWERAAAGEQVDETHVTFLDVRTMLDTLSPRRLELLRHVRRHGAGNVRELAHALGRVRLHARSVHFALVASDADEWRHHVSALHWANKLICPSTRALA